jgi:hypothetical protein
LTWNYKDDDNFSWGGKASKWYKEPYYPMITNTYDHDNIKPTPFDIEDAEKIYLEEHKKKKYNYDYRLHIKMFTKIKYIPQKAKEKIIAYRNNYEELMKQQDMINDE